MMMRLPRSTNWPIRRNIFGLLASGLLVFSAACSPGGGDAGQAAAPETNTINGPRYASDGSAIRPTDWEEWIFVGSPLTPDELNGGNATFKEFHSVYIEPTAFAHFKATGEFPNGTQLAKVRTLLYEGEACSAVDPDNGSCQAVSGRGYFNGDYSGFELTIKDTERFDDPGGWVYYNFGESPSEWAETAQPFPATSCNSCHAVAADNDFVFTQFYPVLRASEPTVSDSRPAAGTNALERDASLEDSRTQLAAVESPVPIDVDALFAYLQDGEYRSMNVQSGIHSTRGPHLNLGQPVKVYFSDAVSQSMEGGYTDHPKGSALVKEIFEPGTENLVGWAVAVKTDENSDRGEGWFWVEFTSTTDPSQVPVPAGNGVPLCSSCHATGSDFVLSELPK